MNTNKDKLMPLSELAEVLDVSYWQLWKWATRGVAGVRLETKEISRLESSVAFFEVFRDRVTEAKQRRRQQGATTPKRRKTRAEQELEKRGY